MSKLSKSKIINIASRDAILKRKIRRHLNSLGFEKTADGDLRIQVGGKQIVRTLHRNQRGERLAANRDFIANRSAGLFRYFATGDDVNPEMISPTLERISANTWQSDLFRWASLTWSVPVSNGYGRRIRYLVWDRSNDKLMGLIAIGDPVFNLSVRDAHIGWNAEDRAARLVNILDAYVLGALPPYNTLLGGKARRLPASDARDLQAISRKSTEAPRESFPKRKRKLAFWL